MIVPEICDANLRDKKDLYFRFGNTVGQVWVIPVLCSSLGLQLFLPSSLKGKIAKLLIPFLIKSQIGRQILKIDLVSVKLPSLFVKLANETFKTNDFVCSFFMGSPSKNQKITVQISKDEKLLGYCKITPQEHIYDLFVREKEMLDFLQKSGVSNVPKCLCCQKIDSLYFYFQSTIRTTNSKFGYQMQLAWDFVNELKIKTGKKILFELSDYYFTITELKNQLASNSYENTNLVVKICEELIKSYFGHELEYTFYHGDFTPWNSFEENGQLFVYDFEYSHYSYPPFLDYYHYFTQTALVNHKRPEIIVDYFYKHIFGQISSKGFDPKELYQMYILEIIHQYINNDYIGGKQNPDLRRKLSLWIEILERIC